MSRLVRLLSLLLLPAAFLVIPPSAATAAPTGAVSAGVTPRECKYFTTGDDLRRLDVCVSQWYSADRTQWRPLVEMHTYRSNGAGGWVDSTSQSITLNVGYFRTDTITRYSFGQDDPANKCRVNSPASSLVSCSVPNTSVVDFYGPAWYGNPASTVASGAITVSWRDDRGQAHKLTRGQGKPYKMPVEDVSNV